MKKFIAFSVSLLSLITISMFQSCSSTDDNNTLQTPKNVTITQSNLEKKWLTTYYTFTANIDQATKIAYQVSSVEVTLSNNNYTIYDRYSQKSDKGTYTLDKGLLTLRSSESPKQLTFKVDKLTNSDIVLNAINHTELTSVELISIR